MSIAIQVAIVQVYHYTHVVIIASSYIIYLKQGANNASYSYLAIQHTRFCQKQNNMIEMTHIKITD